MSIVLWCRPSTHDHKQKEQEGSSAFVKEQEWDFFLYGRIKLYDRSMLHWSHEKKQARNIVLWCRPSTHDHKQKEHEGSSAFVKEQEDREWELFFCMVELNSVCARVYVHVALVS